MKWNVLYQITAASRTPQKEATTPRSPFSLSSTEFGEPSPNQNSWLRHWPFVFICNYKKTSCTRAYYWQNLASTMKTKHGTLPSFRGQKTNEETKK